MSAGFVRSLAAGLLAFASAGCGVFGGVRVETLDVSSQKPSNVALYVEVTDQGESVTNLEAKNFKIYENEELLSSKQTGKRLLPTEDFTDQRILVLVDVSGNPSREQKEIYAKAAEAFV